MDGAAVQNLKTSNGIFQSNQDKKDNKSRQQQVIYQEVQTPANSTA